MDAIMMVLEVFDIFAMTAIVIVIVALLQKATSHRTTNGLKHRQLNGKLDL